VWAEIIAFKRRGKYDEAEALISRTAQKLLGFDADLLRQLSDEGIVQLLRRPDPSDVELYLVAAELLAEQGEIDELRGDRDQGYDCYHKALSLYLETCLGAPEGWSASYADKVTFLLDRLRDYPLPPTVDRKLFRYLELQGDYGQAENVLFRLAEAGDPEASAAGDGFYERLREKTDEELEQGGLPRDEMEEGAAEFSELVR
jgi:tetratricopeptide (TPR) repeat protein